MLGVVSDAFLCRCCSRKYRGIATSDFRYLLKRWFVRLFVDERTVFSVGVLQKKKCLSSLVMIQVFVSVLRLSTRGRESFVFQLHTHGKVESHDETDLILSLVSIVSNRKGTIFGELNLKLNGGAPHRISSPWATQREFEV